MVLKFDSASWNHGVKSIYYSFFFCLPFLDTEYDIVNIVQDKDVHLIQWMENDLKLPVV